MRAFWDASSVVPLCIPQAATALSHRVRRDYRELVVWWGTPVEVHSAIARMASSEATNGRPAAAVARLAVLRQSWREVLPSERLRSLAEHLARGQRLRAGDLFQLAAALDWCSQRPRSRVFVCFDQRLAKAAQEIGFTVLSEP